MHKDDQFLFGGPVFGLVGRDSPFLTTFDQILKLRGGFKDVFQLLVGEVLSSSSDGLQDVVDLVPARRVHEGRHESHDSC